jgi:hypothetical protein
VRRKCLFAQTMGHFHILHSPPEHMLKHQFMHCSSLLHRTARYVFPCMSPAPSFALCYVNEGTGTLEGSTRSVQKPVNPTSLPKTRVSLRLVSQNRPGIRQGMSKG